MWSRTGACAVDNAIGGLPARRADTRIRPSIAWTSLARVWRAGPLGSQQVNNRRIAAQIDRATGSSAQERAHDGVVLPIVVSSARTYPDQRRRGGTASVARCVHVENGSSDSARPVAPEDARPRLSAPQPPVSPSPRLRGERGVRGVLEPLCAAPAVFCKRQSRSSRRRRRTCSHFFHLTCAKDVAEHHRSCPVCARPSRASSPCRTLATTRRGSPPSTPTATGNSPPPRWSRCPPTSPGDWRAICARSSTTAVPTLGPRRRWVHRALRWSDPSLPDFVRRNFPRDASPPPASSSPSSRTDGFDTGTATVPRQRRGDARFSRRSTARRSATGERSAGWWTRSGACSTPTGTDASIETSFARDGLAETIVASVGQMTPSRATTRRSWVTTSTRVATRASWVTSSTRVAPVDRYRLYYVEYRRFESARRRFTASLRRAHQFPCAEASVARRRGASSRHSSP